MYKIFIATCYFVAASFSRVTAVLFGMQFDGGITVNNEYKFPIQTDIIYSTDVNRSSFSLYGLWTLVAGQWPQSQQRLDLLLPPESLDIVRREHGLILISQARSSFPGSLFHETDLIFTSHDGAGELL
jgi:hypothetical protein